MPWSRRWAWRLPPSPQPKIKIGVIFDLTGPLAGGGSELHDLGAKIMIDYFVKKGGVEGYQIEAIYADAQSKPDVAINEAVRLIEQEKVDMVLGFFSSAQCVPVAARVEQLKKFMWITTCISSAVLENRNLKYVFRAQPSGSQFGVLSMDFVAQNAKEKLGKEPKDLRVAIIHEDGAYGVDVCQGQRGRRQEGRLQPRAEGRLFGHRARPLGAGDQAQARAARRHLPHRLQPRHHAVPSPGTRARPEVQRVDRSRRRLRRLREAQGGIGQGRQLHSTTSIPISIWSTNRRLSKPKLPPLIKMVGEEYEKAKPGTTIRSAHVGMAARNSYVFFTEVLPRAIKKYGGVDADALRKAALEVDLPEGGTMLGFGVKFAGEGSPIAGQNLRASPVITQYIDDKSYVVWPKSQAQREAVLQFPAGTTYSREVERPPRGGP